MSKRGRLEGPHTSGLGSQLSAADEEEEVRQAKKTAVQDKRFLFKVRHQLAGMCTNIQSHTKEVVSIQVCMPMAHAAI